MTLPEWHLAQVEPLVHSYLLALLSSAEMKLLPPDLRHHYVPAASTANDLDNWATHSASQAHLGSLSQFSSLSALLFFSQKLRNFSAIFPEPARICRVL